MYNILFVSHDTARSGAQILLLQFLKWVKENQPDIKFEILLGRDGDLANEFESITKTHIWKKYSPKSLNPFNHFKRFLQISKFKSKAFDLIFSNTIVNGEILHELSSLKAPVITHVHEMDYWINKAGKNNLSYVKKYSTKYIAASNAVRSCLINNYAISPARIETIYEHVSFSNLTKNREKLSLREKLNIPFNSIIIGASGAENWRKGKDWFIPLALNVLIRMPDSNIHFIWIGGSLNYELKHDYNSIAQRANIHFIEHLPDAYKYFHEFSIFAMLSREDPFPVVNLEAASLGVPIVCFENAGGTPELVSDGCGFSVPYGDLNSFADKIIYLIDNEKERKQMGDIASYSVKTKYDIEIIAPEMIKFILS